MKNIKQLMIDYDNINSKKEFKFNIIIESFIFKNENNDFYIFIGVDENLLVRKFSGYIKEPYENLQYEIICTEENNEYGRFFNIISYKIIEPKTENDLYEYLISGIIKGINTDKAEKIIKTFGMDSLNIIKNNPNKLLQIPGIGEKTIDKIVESYKKNNIPEDIIIFLKKFKFSLKLINKIFEAFKDNTKELITKNPFILIEIEGIGFKKIDEISEFLNIKKDDINRIEALILYNLENDILNGDMYSNFNILKKSVLLNILNNIENFEIAYSNLLINKKIKEIYFNEKCVYSIEYFNYEKNIVQEIYRILNAKSFNLDFNNNENFSNIMLTDEQKNALKSAFEENIFILTGGPGTGKTTILKEIVLKAELENLNILLAAPTGRAASRLEDATNKETSTIHRLLEYGYNFEENEKNNKEYKSKNKILSFKKNKSNPLNADIILIDEFSMVDSWLFYNLLVAIENGTKLILIGDSNQLPSVNAGNILEELIKSKLINTKYLSKIHRQSENSDIIKNAHKILNFNKNLSNLKINNTDFFLINPNKLSPEEEILNLYMNRLPKKYKINPLDIAILTPSKKGELGSIKLNQLIQKKVNINAKEYFQNNKTSILHVNFYGSIFFINDKVMQTKNNYTINYILKNDIKDKDIIKETQKMINNDENLKQGIFNGEIGFIIDIKNNSEIIVDFGNKIAIYNNDTIKDLSLSYAMTIHKSQGNEFDFCIIPIKKIPYPLKTKKLIYTGITRSKKILILIGSEKDFYELISSSNNIIRKSNLSNFMNLYFEK